VLEGTEKNIVIGECQIMLSFQLIASSEKWEYFSEHIRMLATYVLHVYTLKNGSSPSVVWQLVQVPPMLVYAIHYKNISCTPIIFMELVMDSLTYK
jgi:hypothetical protein